MESIITHIERELISATTVREHPFRTFTMATIGDGNPYLRTVVLRKLADGFNLVFYTDSRSQKIGHLLKNPNCAALFYDRDQKVQLTLKGHATISKHPSELHKIWSTLSQRAKKEYQTAKAPGTLLNHADEVEYLNETNYFSLVTLKPSEIEYLALHPSSNHHRIKFNKVDGQWNDEFLVP